MMHSHVSLADSYIPSVVPVSNDCPIKYNRISFLAFLFRIKSKMRKFNPVIVVSVISF